MSHSFRNAKYSSGDGNQIDMEVDHPDFGWIPFTARRDDIVGQSSVLFAAAIQGDVGAYIPPTPPLPTVDDYEEAIQSYVDQAARGRQFRDGVTLASYVSSTIPQWSLEAQAFISWRDVVWAYAYQELTKVMSGEREQPTIEQIVSELPTIVWP